MKTRQKPTYALLRLLFVLFIFGSAFVFVMFQGDVVSWTIFYVLIPFVTYSVLIFFYPMKDFTVTRQLQAKIVQRGERAQITLALRRRIPFPLLYIVMAEKWGRKEVSTRIGSTSRKMLVLGFRRQMEWTYELDNLERGEYELEGCMIELYDFFGWIRKKRIVPVSNTLIVLPKMMDIHYAPLQTQYEQGTVVSPHALIKDTTLVTGIREYQPGDRVSWIHWKAFAKTENLMTKEFEERQTQELTIVFDSRQSETFEEQIVFTASLMNKVSSFRTTLSFIIGGEQPILIRQIQTKEQLHKAFIELAKIQPGRSNALLRLPQGADVFQKGSRILVVTGNPDWALLEPLCRQVMNPSSILCFVIQHDASKPSAQLQRQLAFARSKGVSVQVVAEGQFKDAFKEVASL